uniref:NPF family transporter n=1 Tax=Pinus pinaster TaxID=71647 RepID=A0A1S6YCR7_PINPS|nr:NPF family transporter [Pinus pinaster]
MVSKTDTDNYPSTSPQETILQQPLVEFSEAPARSSSSAIKLLGAFPPAIKFIFWNECCERFSFYGLKAILALFLSERLGLSQVRSTEMFHLFTMTCYATPILGALISDTLLGKYRTILSLSLLYAVGNCVMSMAAIPDPDPVTKKASSYSMWSTATGLLFIAFGTGGIKPCVAAFGGDQIEFSMPDGDTKEKLRVTFFSVFYFAINVGAFLSMLLTPLLRANVSYAAAFGMPSVLMVLATFIFWVGRKDYVDRRAVGSVFSTVVKVLVNAVRLRKSDSVYKNYEEIDCGGGSIRASHWLDAAKSGCGAEEVEDVKALFKMCLFLIPGSMFSCMYGQKASTWVFQATQMNGHVSWLGNVVIRPDQMQAIDPLLVLIFIPLFDQVLYPFLEKHGVAMTAIRRMILGMLLCSVAFFTSGLLQLAIDKRTTPGSITSYINIFSGSEPDNWDRMNLAYPTENSEQISILWQIPQYAILTAAEVLFSVTGLEFAYSQAPVSMKSVVQAIWCFTSAGGDLITIIIVEIIGNKLSIGKRSSLFAGGGIIATVFMLWLSSCFKEADNPSDEEVMGTGNSEVESTVMVSG